MAGDRGMFKLSGTNKETELFKFYSDLGSFRVHTGNGQPEPRDIQLTAHQRKSWRPSTAAKGDELEAGTGGLRQIPVKSSMYSTHVCPGF